MKDYQKELFVYKYRPQTLDALNRPELSIFSNIIEKKTIPNMILYGLSNSGKKTALYAFLRSKYGNINTRCTYKEFKINTKKVNIPIFHSLYHVEVDVLSFYSRIRTILPELIKGYTQTKNVINNQHKLFIIHHVEQLEMQTQHMLRRILEIYMDNCRFIFITTKLNKITQPLQSRCLIIRIPRFTTKEVGNIISNINSQLDTPIENSKLKEISVKYGSNIKDAIFRLESIYYDIDIESNYIYELREFILKIKNTKTIDMKLYEYIDNYLYECLYKNIYIENIINDAFMIICDIIKDPQVCNIILKKFINSDETLNNGSREVMHIQSLFYYIVDFFHNTSV